MQLIAEEPTKVHLELGVYLANKSNLPDKGLVALDFLEPSQRVDPELSLWRASLLLDLGMNQEALAVLKEAQGIPEVLYHRSRVAISLGQEDVAQEAWALLPALSEHADLSAKGTYFAAHLAQLLGYYGQAWNWFDHVTEPPWLHEALLAQAMLLTQLAERQEWDRLGGSLEEVRLGLDRVRREAKAPLVKQAWAIEANLMRESNKSEEFLEVLHEAISTDSANDFLLYLRATEALYLGDLALAEQDLRRIIRVDPEDARALNALGYVLADRTSRLVEAYRLIDKALTLEPDNPAILDSMGWVNFRLGRLDEAVYYLEWAYELEKDPVIRDHLIQALEEIGDSDRAVWLREGELEATELSVPMADKESTP